MRDNFWKSGKSAAFAQFASSMPSDAPAYRVAYAILGIEGKKVLDYGCFRGTGSSNILEAGAAEVLGVDRIAEHVDTARKVHKNKVGLQFAHVAEGDYIPRQSYFDCAYMGFVHPTIDNIDELYYSFQKIADSLKSGGKMVIVGLHKDSFNPKHRFKYCAHRPPSAGFKDGASYQNQLKTLGGEALDFNDYYWSNKTLFDSLEMAGFTNVQLHEVHPDRLPPELAKILTQSLDAIDKSPYPVTWYDEWEAPLYQIISAEKK